MVFLANVEHQGIAIIAKRLNFAPCEFYHHLLHNDLPCYRKKIKNKRKWCLDEALALAWLRARSLQAKQQFITDQELRKQRRAERLSRSNSAGAA